MAHEPRAAQDQAPRRPHVLVAEDDPIVLELIVGLLELAGFDVTAAADGAEALEALAHRAPRVVVLDLMMPRINGREVIAHLRSDPVLASTPVVVVSAVLGTREAADLDADALVPKPFEPDDLVQLVTRLARLAPRRTGI